MAGPGRSAPQLEHFTVRSGRAILSVTVAGQGEAVVFLHAGVADRRMWWAQLSAFAADHFVIAYDRRGFGDTACKAEPFSQIADLDGVLEAVDVERAVLVGCSQGGRIAIDYALTHPERVAGCVLVAPAVSGAPEPEAYPGPIQSLMSDMNAAEAAGDVDGLNRLEAHAWLDGPTQKEGRLSGNIRTLFLDMNGIALRAPDPGPQRDNIDAYRRFRELKMPIEIVSGSLDFPHINERNVKLSGQVRRAHLTVVDGAAHLVPLEVPGQFNAILKRALKRM